MNVTALPTEILLWICEEECITQEDIISLRLTCKALGNIATSILFRCVYISPLKHDRETFLAICHSPHLAQHVYLVEWQELEWVSGYFDELVSLPQYEEDDETDQMLGTFERMANGLFWLPWKGSEGSREGRFQRESELEEIISNFRQEFITAVNLLPRLRVMISRPMPRDRVLHPCAYPLTAGILSSQLWPIPSNETEPTKPNCGLLLFILPAMETLKTPVTTLIWEENFTIQTSYSRFLPSTADSLKFLESLSICISSIADSSDETSLSHFLDSCSTIRHLSLCSQDRPLMNNLHELVMFYTSPLEQQPIIRWSGLVSIAFTSIMCVRDHLAKLIRANAQTLRSIFIKDCGVDLRAVKQIALIPDLRLESVQLRGTPGMSGYALAVEGEFLKFLIQDHEFIQDIGSEASGQVEAGWTADSNHAWYNAFIKPDEGTEISYHGMRSVILTSESGIRDRTQYWRPNQEEENLSDAGSSDGSEDSLDIRRRTRPKWSWGTFYHNEPVQGEIYYFPAAESEPGFYTEIWRFTSRDNRVGYGKDPLEWFDEWDLEMGDVEQPLPYNDELHRCAKEQKRGYYVRDTESSQMGKEEEPKPPSGAILYDGDEAWDTSEYWWTGGYDSDLDGEDE